MQSFLFLGFGKLFESPGNKRQKAQAGTNLYFDIFERNSAPQSWTFVHSPEVHHVHHFVNHLVHQYLGPVMASYTLNVDVKPQAETKLPEQEFDLPYDIGPDVDFDVHPQIPLPGTLLTWDAHLEVWGWKQQWGNWCNVNFTGNHGLCKHKTMPHCPRQLLALNPLSW